MLKYIAASGFPTWWPASQLLPISIAALYSKCRCINSCAICLQLRKGGQFELRAPRKEAKSAAEEARGQSEERERERELYIESY